MTFAPPTLLDLAGFYDAHGGVMLGIVGDGDHAATGVSYHLGADQLRAGAYSNRTARDRAGLTNAASAIDLGRINGSLDELRAFSVWLVIRARVNAPGTRDIREIIYSDNGARVLRWDRENGAASPPHTGEADSSHLTHTHVSYYRDSQGRDKIAAFEGWSGFMTPQAVVTDESPATITVAPGDWYDLDGKTVVVPDGPALGPRSSPYGTTVPKRRAMYATIGGKRRVVLVVAKTSAPVPVPPAPDCADEIAAAVAADRAKARIAIDYS